MIRNAIVSGMFYPKDKKDLSKMLKNFENNVSIKKKYRIVISPHAGYIYSGLTAFYSIASLKHANVFIIIGPNHNVIGNNFAIDTSEFWKTPLGNVEIERDIVEEVINNEPFSKDSTAHKFEHSIEVQIPFIQYIFGDVKIIPISIINTSYDDYFLKRCEMAGRVLARIVKRKNICLIASSDFTHYMERSIAIKMDMKAIDRIKKLDTKGFFRILSDTNASICGYGPITIAMSMGKELGMKTAEVIHTSCSGDYNKDYSSVVTYYSIGLI